MWCVTELNDEYVERMEDILDLYAKPINPEEPVICFDEKTYQLQDHKHKNPIREIKPGKEKRVDYQYKQGQSVNIFSYFQLGVGEPALKTTERRQRKDFAFVAAEIVEKYSKAKTIHLVMDNLNIHSEKSLTDTFGIERGKAIWSQFTIHHTPKHASWLNQAELLISVFYRQALFKRRIPSIKQLNKILTSWTQQNKGFKTKWCYTSKNARNTFKYSRIN